MFLFLALTLMYCVFRLPGKYSEKVLINNTYLYPRNIKITSNVIGVHNAPSYNVPFCPICLFMGVDSRAKNKVINESCLVLNS